MSKDKKKKRKVSLLWRLIEIACLILTFMNFGVIGDIVVAIVFEVIGQIYLKIQEYRDKKEEEHTDA